MTKELIFKILNNISSFYIGIVLGKIAEGLANKLCIYLFGEKKEGYTILTFLSVLYIIAYYLWLKEK